MRFICPYDSRYAFFYIVVWHNRSFLKILWNFSILRRLQMTFLNLYFPEYKAAINFTSSKAWLRIWVNDVILKNNTTRVEFELQLVEQFALRRTKIFGSYTAVSTKVVQRKCKSVRDNVDWHYGKWEFGFAWLRFNAIQRQGKRKNEYLFVLFPFTTLKHLEVHSSKCKTYYPQ